MGNEPTYDVFLSYNSLDREQVSGVAEGLKQRGCRPFLDQWYLKPGRSWVETLERALAESRAVAVFIGPHDMGRWQQRERAWALDQLTRRRDFAVIPVLLRGCEPPLGFLQQLMWIDLRDDPTDAGQLDALAASIRGEKVDRDGRKQPQAMICPYRGLLAFREEDAEFFFGRDDYQQRLLEIVERNPIVAVVGASGSGKSSLVSAGLLPRLRKQTSPVWDIVRMVPNVDPLYSLAQSLVPLIEPALSGLAFEEKLGEVAGDLHSQRPRTPLWGLVNAVLRQQSGTDRLLLFVDQWEEIYTNCEDPSRRERFIAELLEAISRKDSPLSVVLTVRGDFYNEILGTRELVDRIQAGRLDVGPMNVEELRSVIEGPANRIGVDFQDGLVDRILYEAGQEPGRLALLEFALKELWDRREGNCLTHAGYEDLGRRPHQASAKAEKVAGVDSCLSRAIATYAEAVYGTLGQEERDALPPLIRRLVRAGTSPDQDTRRRVLLSELDEPARVVARKLSDARLLITQRVESGSPSEALSAGEVGPDPESNPGSRDDVAVATIVEVAHEELLRRWGRLGQWVNEDRAFLLWRSRLDLKVEEYRRDGSSALFYGRPLRESKRYYPARAADLDQHHRVFLEHSLAAGRRRSFLIAGGVFALLAMLCGLLALNRRNAAAELRRQASARQLLDATMNHIEEEELDRAELYLRTATDRLGENPPSDLQERISHASREIELSETLHRIEFERGRLSEGKGVWFDNVTAQKAYKRVLGKGGLVGFTASADLQPVAERIRKLAARHTVAKAVDNWALVCRYDIHYRDSPDVEPVDVLTDRCARLFELGSLIEGTGGVLGQTLRKNETWMSPSVEILNKMKGQIETLRPADQKLAEILPEWMRLSADRARRSLAVELGVTYAAVGEFQKYTQEELNQEIEHMLRDAGRTDEVELAEIKRKGELYLRLCAELEPTLRTVHRMFPDDFWMNYNLSRHLRDLGIFSLDILQDKPRSTYYWSTSLRYIERSMAVDPDNPIALYVMVSVYYRMGKANSSPDQLGEAIRVLDRILEDRDDLDQAKERKAAINKEIEKLGGRSSSQSESSKGDAPQVAD